MPIVGTEYCMRGACREVRVVRSTSNPRMAASRIAPQMMPIEPEHDGWVVGTEPAVIIELDFEHENGSTIRYA